MPNEWHCSRCGIADAQVVRRTDGVDYDVPAHPKDADCIAALKAVRAEDTRMIDWLEAVAVLPVEIDNYGAEWPCFLTIADGHPAGFEGPDDPGQKNSRWQDIGLRAVLRMAMASYQRRVVTVRHENATLDDLPPALRAEVEARLKREFREFPDA